MTTPTVPEHTSQRAHNAHTSGLAESVTDRPAFKQAYSLPEVQYHTSLSRAQVFKEIAAGRLKAKKIGRRTIVTFDDLAKFLSELPDAAEALG